MWSPSRWTLAATILGSSMTFIDATVVNVALPALQADLHATITDVQWVIEAYALFLGALILVGGSMGDQFGRKRVFLFGVAVLHGRVDLSAGSRRRRGVSLSAARCRGSARPSSSRAASPSSARRSTTRERGRAIGTWSGFSAITAAIGPVTGGWLDRTRQLARGVFPERAARCRRARPVGPVHGREPRSVPDGPDRLDAAPRSPSSAWAASSSACSNGRRSGPVIRWWWARWSIGRLSLDPVRGRRASCVEPDAAARACSGREPSRSPICSPCCCMRRCVGDLSSSCR